MIPLISQEPGAIATGAVLLVLSIFGTIQGVRIWRDPVPRFVLQYRGWSNPGLSLPFGGVTMATMGLYGIQPRWPMLFAGVFALLWLVSGVIFLLGMFVWYPWFLLPRWYRRARKAGVPRNNLEEMAAFKALPVEEQKRRANPFR